VSPEAKEILTPFGETLFWKYYTYIIENPIRIWDVPTYILYAGYANSTGRDTIHTFVTVHNCHLNVMKNGEHWFHTDEHNRHHFC
jgi:hypothetical protein